MTKLAKILENDLLLVLAIILAVTAHFILLGPYSLVIVGDEGDSILSVLTAAPYFSSDNPYWFRFSAAGTDLRALGYSPPLDMVLFTHLPVWLAYGLRHVLESGAAVLGIYLMARQRLELDRAAAGLAALAAGIFFARMTLAYASWAFMPLLLMATGALLKQPKDALRWIVALIVWGLFATTAHIQFLILFPIPVVVLWVWIAEGRRGLWDLALVVGLFVYAYAWRALDIWALFGNAAASMRASWQHYNLPVEAAAQNGLSRVTESFDPTGLFSMAPTPSLAIAILSGLALVFGVVYFWRSKPAVRPIALFLLAVAACEVLAPVMKSLMYDLVPAIRGFSMNKLWTTASPLLFLGPALTYAALGAEAGRGYQMVRRGFAGLIIVGGAISIGSWFVHQWLSHGNYTQIYRSPVMEAAAKRINQDAIPGRSVSFRLYEAFPNAYGIESIGGTLVLVSKRYNRFWVALTEPSIGIDLVADDYLLKYGHTMNVGLTFSVPFTAQEARLSSRLNLNLLSLANVRYVFSRDLLSDPELELMDVPAPAGPWNANSRLGKVWESLKANFTGRTILYAYENKAALPRFFLAQELDVLDGPDAVIAALKTKSTEQLRTRVLVERDAAPTGVAGPFVGGRVTAEHYGEDRIELTLEPDGDGPMLLFGGNSFSPYWRAEVDGQPTPIFPADETFWGLVLPSGARHVTFTYEPPYGF